MMPFCQSTRVTGATIVPSMVVPMVLAIVLAGCSTSPPVRVNADGQRVQRVCEEVQSASGSRVNSRVCRDVVIEDDGGEAGSGSEGTG